MAPLREEEVQEGQTRSVKENKLEEREREYAPLDVDLVVREPERVDAVREHARERLVDLPQVDVVLGDAAALEDLGDGDGGALRTTRKSESVPAAHGEDDKEEKRRTMPMIRGGRPATDVATCLPRISSPSSSARRRVMRRTPATPSVIWLALPPVVVPLPHCGNALRILPSASLVVPGRMPSSLVTRTLVRCGVGPPAAAGVEGSWSDSIGRISLSKRPDAWAWAARCCEMAASSSMRSREMLKSVERVGRR